MMIQFPSLPLRSGTAVVLALLSVMYMHFGAELVSRIQIQAGFSNIKKPLKGAMRLLLLYSLCIHLIHESASDSRAVSLFGISLLRMFGHAFPHFFLRRTEACILTGVA